MAKALFDDEFFQDTLVAALVRDRGTLKAVGHLLTPNDFSPVAGHRNGHNRWITAQLALDYWRRYRHPIGKMLRAEVLDYAATAKVSKKRREELLRYVEELESRELVGLQSLTDKVLSLQREKLTAKALEEMIELQAAGKLTKQKWWEVTQRVLSIGEESPKVVVDYLDTLEDRIHRRLRNFNRPPLFLIAPLDELITGPGFGQLALVLAPYGRGKSMFLIWMALVYALQKLNVLLVTLEDPRELVEDRLDAAVTSLPIFRLRELPKTVESRFRQWSRLVGGRLKVYDGTDEQVTVAKIEQVYLSLREQGFVADALLVDYDDEIVPTVRREARRLEMADIYRDLRKLAARHHLIVWTASQAQRGTEDVKILSGDRVAEDISKLRKVSVCISLGRGEWGPDSIYLHVAKHKFDKQHVGCNIYADKERMLIYDAERTRLKYQEQRSDRS